MSRVGLGSLGRRWREGPSGWILWKEGDVSEGAGCPSDKGWLAVRILHPCQLSGGGVLLGPRSIPELFLKLRKTLGHQGFGVGPVSFQLCNVGQLLSLSFLLRVGK